MEENEQDNIEKWHSMNKASHLLTQPDPKEKLYKMVKSKYFDDMKSKNYLYFSRVDTYEKDPKDSQLFPRDQALARKSPLEHDPNHNGADLYEAYRQNTYACCFSLNLNDYLINEYSGGEPYHLLEITHEYLTKMLMHSKIQGPPVNDKGLILPSNIFALNSGICNYEDSKTTSLIERNGGKLPNIFLYGFHKDNNYEGDNEFRIALTLLDTHSYRGRFPKHLCVHFDFDEAISSSDIKIEQFEAGCYPPF